MEIRRNSHYGQSPIAYPLKSPLLFLGQWRSFVTHYFHAHFYVRDFLYKGEKLMKKLLATFLAVCASVAAFAFAGCDNGSGENGGSDKNGEVILEVQSVAFTAKGDYITLSETTSVKDYMDALKDNGELVFGGENGSYGYYITSFYATEEKIISSSATSSEGYSWSFYIDFISLEGDDAIYASDYTTYEYNGKTFYPASFGVSGIPCVEGHSYLFVYEYYNFSW